MESPTQAKQQQMTDLEILVFGPQARVVGADRLTLKRISLPLEADQLLGQIAAAYPDLAVSLSVSRLAINHEFADASSLINTGDEIALVGLISGG